MSEKPQIDPYPEPVAMTSINLRRVNQKQAEKGRDDRLRRLARRNRDVAWLLVQGQTEPKKASKPK